MLVILKEGTLAGCRFPLRLLQWSRHRYTCDADTGLGAIKAYLPGIDATQILGVHRNALRLKQLQCRLDVELPHHGRAAVAGRASAHVAAASQVGLELGAVFWPGLQHAQQGADGLVYVARPRGYT